MRALHLLLGICFIQTTGAPFLLSNPYVVDFSQAHETTIIKDAIPTARASDGFVHFENEPVLIRFPGGREIEFMVSHATVRTKDGEAITSMSLYSAMMPTEEAAEVMRTFMKSIDQSDADVDRWLKEVKDEKHLQRLAFRKMGARTKTGGHYPRIQLICKDSMNPVYEWTFNFNIEWSPVLFLEGWDEAKAAIHNPRPPEGFERISLDPPSGLFYDNREGWEEHLGIDLDPKLAEEVAPEAPSPVPSATPQTEPQAQSMPEIADTTDQEPDEEDSPWWPWLLAIVLMLAAGIWFIRRK